MAVFCGSAADGVGTGQSGKRRRGSQAQYDREKVRHAFQSVVWGEARFEYLSFVTLLAVRY